MQHILVGLFRQRVKYLRKVPVYPVFAVPKESVHYIASLIDLLRISWEVPATSAPCMNLNLLLSGCDLYWLRSPGFV